MIALGPLGDVQVRAVNSRGFLTLSDLATDPFWLCYFRASSIGSASQAAALDILISVALAAVPAFLFPGERVSDIQRVGIVFMVVSAVLNSG